jgi:hypothetical protein
VRFIHDDVVPQTLIKNNAKEEVKERATVTCDKYQINIKTTVPYSQCQNKSEVSIREIKKNVRRTLHRTNTPLKLWPYCTEWCAAVQRLTAITFQQLNNYTPTEGQRYALFKGIVDHRYVYHEREMVYTDKNGRSQPKTSTLRWELCARWANDSSSWLPLASVKDLNPIKATEYAVSRDLDLEPAFK